MKRRAHALRDAQIESPPSRGRGLKLLDGLPGDLGGRVAPFAGARIETSQFAWAFSALVVAPFAGARIETRPSWSRNCASPSRPLRGGAD